jgi:hypothetical protein
LTKRDQADALEEEAKSLREQISSMQQRFQILSKLAGTENSPENNNQLVADIASVNDQVPALLILRHILTAGLPRSFNPRPGGCDLPFVHFRTFQFHLELYGR